MMLPAPSPYDARFYADRDTQTRLSADVVLDLVFTAAPHIASVVDVGCGVGTWLCAAAHRGAQGVYGYEGHWLDRQRLLIDEDRFEYRDLDTSDPEGAFRPSDLAICLEVAEHVRETQADSLIAQLCQCADMVLFSAAIPGQGGKGHVNEQWPEYWCQKFARHGHVAIAPFRDSLWTDQRVLPWYRQNLFLAVKPERLDALMLDDAQKRTTPLPLVHPAVYQAALARRDNTIAELGTVRGAWRALRRALKTPGYSSTPRLATDPKKQDL